MHSSRMRTVRCCGHLSCHTCLLPCIPPVMHTPHHAHPCHIPHHTHPLPCMPPCHAHPATHAHCHAHPHHAHPPVDRILDTCLWKHYLSATIVADGNNFKTGVYLYQFPIHLSTQLCILSTSKMLIIQCKWRWNKPIRCISLLLSEMQQTKIWTSSLERSPFHKQH